MRHLGSLIAGILIAPVAWLLIALGQQKSTTLVAGWVAANRFDTVDLIVPTAYLVAAGVLLGLVATLRVSPLGPLVAGLALVAPTVSLFIAPLSTLDRMPHSVSFGSLHIDPRVPVANGTLPLVGVLLVIAVFSATRWRRWPVPVAVDAVDAVDEPEVETASPYVPGFGGGVPAEQPTFGGGPAEQPIYGGVPVEQPTTIAGGWPEATPTYTVPPGPEPTSSYAIPTSEAPPVTETWVPPTQRSGTQVTSGVSDYESEPPPLPSRGARPSPRPRHAAFGTGELTPLGTGESAQLGPVDRLAEAQRHAAAQTAAVDAAYQAEATRQTEPPAADPAPLTEADQRAIAEVNRRTLAEAQAEASRRAAAELQAEAERRALAETQRRALARAQAEAQREADLARSQPEPAVARPEPELDLARQTPFPTTAPTSPARTETYWPEDTSAETTRLPDPQPGTGLRPDFTQPTSPAPQPTSPAEPPVQAQPVPPVQAQPPVQPVPPAQATGPVWPAEDPATDDDGQAERDRIAAQEDAERRAALLAEAERRAQERVRNPRGDEPPTSPWSAPPRSR